VESITAIRVFPGPEWKGGRRLVLVTTHWSPTFAKIYLRFFRPHRPAPAIANRIAKGSLTLDGVQYS